MNVLAHFVSSTKTPTGKHPWMLYDRHDSDEDGVAGSVRTVYAADYEALVGTVSLEHEIEMHGRLNAALRDASSLETLAALPCLGDSMRSMSAQNEDDYSQIVRWYEDGTITMMANGTEKPYEPLGSE